MKRWIIFLLLLFVFTALGFAYWQYHKAHRNTADEEAAYSLQASALFREYEANEEAANHKYLDKLLQVQGVVASIDTSNAETPSIALQTQDPLYVVSCQLLPQETRRLGALSEGQEVKVKGICTGKLMDIVLVRGVLAD